MNVFVCVDDSFGMLFNNRRQSRDIVLTNKLVEISGSSKLWISEFSKSLFSDFDNPNIIINDNFLEKAEDGDFCFVENKALSSYVDKIEKLIVFKWNRSYPSDFTLDVDLSSWKLIRIVDFEGNSHEKITMEEYEK